MGKPRPKVGKNRESKRADVGYGKPPEEHQFKPGHYHPGPGRPRGVRHLLRELASSAEGELLINVALKQAAKRGNIQVIDYLEKYGALDTGEVNPKTMTTKELAEAIRRDMETKQSEEPEITRS